MVDIIIEKTTFPILKQLCDPVVRATAGVLETNKYLFANVEKSENHALGYSDIRDMCHKLGIPNINTTSNRHRSASLIRNKTDMDTNSMDVFYDHMSHSKEIDKYHYAAPPADRILDGMVPILEEFKKVN